MAQVNKQAIAAAFGRAATHYEQHAELQRQSADALLARLDGRAFSQVLDAGCGPGRMSRYWREQGSEVCALDLSAQMLTEAQRHDVATAICWRILKPFRRLLLLSTRPSNLAVQWCSDLRGALRELYRVVRLAGRWRLVPRRKGQCRNFVRRGERLMSGSTPIVFARGATGKRPAWVGR